MRLGRRVLTASAAALLLVVSGAVPAMAMSFSLVPLGENGRCGERCPMAISAQGEITNATPDEFIAFVRDSAGKDVASVVLLDSPGGKVVSSMELGQAFRKLGVAAIVARPLEGAGLAAGRCFSACVYAFMGARKRVIPPESRIGIHRMFSYESAADPAGGTSRSMLHDDGGMREILARYSAMMGVSRGLIDTAEQTSSETIHVLSPAEIARWHLGASVFSADIRRTTHARR